MESEQQKRVLHAEDDHLVREMVNRYIERLGHTCVSVDDAARAWEVVQGGDHHFDLVISDYDMPEMNGLDFLKQLRSYPATQEIPFVLYTGTDDQELRENVQELGGNFELKLGSVRKLLATYLP